MLLYLYLLFAITAFLIFWGATRVDRIYQLPFLAGAISTGFILPQAVGLTYYVIIPEDAVIRVLLMAALCSLMIFAGYVWPKRPLQIADWKFDGQRLIQVSFVLTTVGACFWIMIWQMPREAKGMQWSGTPVAYLFFARMFEYGFAIAALTFAHTKSRKALIIATIGALIYLQRVLFAAQREDAAEFFFVVVLAAWFGRRRAIPRWIMLTVFVAGLLIVNFNIGQIRALSRDGLTIEDLNQIEWNVELEYVLSGKDEFIIQSGGGELEAAAYYMDAVEQSSSYDFGVYHWNQLVFNYIPAQLLGDSFKQSFYIQSGLQAIEANADPFLQYRYDKRTGLTTTGFTDSFNSFWYFGCLKFFIVAFIMSKIYRAAQRGHYVAQILCMTLTVPAMHIVTHSTHWFFKFWPHMILFLVPALIFARARK